MKNTDETTENAKNIDVNNPEILNNMEATNAPVNIKDLSPDARRSLLKQLADEEKAEKAQKTKNKAAFKELQTEFLTKNIDGLVERQQSMELLISELFKDYQPILDLKKEVFGSDVLDQESHTITHPDGSSSISIGYNINIIFDGTESAGVQKIKEFLLTLSNNDENAQKLSAAVNVLLKPNGKTGMLNPARIIQLDQMRDKFNSPEFDEAIEIIKNAQHRAKSSMYVSGYKFITLEDSRQKKLEFRFTV